MPSIVNCGIEASMRSLQIYAFDRPFSELQFIPAYTYLDDIGDRA